MIDRIWYAWGMARRHREMLRRYILEKALQSDSVLQCDPVLWKSQGIKGMGIDLDGVLVPYGETLLSKEIGSWLNSCVEIFGADKIFILTNNPTPQRIKYFANQVKGVDLILSKRKKPYPDGIQQILQRLQIPASALMIIDDRLLTGILAAVIVKASGCYITNPLVCLTKKPIQELFFMALRKMERIFI